MKHFFTLLLLSTVLLFNAFNTSFGQVTKRTHSNYFLTPEIGVTYSDADISTRTSLGLGLKFGYTYAKYRNVEFDLRGRYFVGQWLGQNRHNSDLTNYAGGIYSDANSDYQNSLGYVVRNNKTVNNNFALEGLLRFNVGAKRIFAPYIFGGIAASVYNVKSNLLDSDGFIYAYEPDFVPATKAHYDKIQDKFYETKVYGNKIFGSLTGNVGLGFSVNVSDGFRIGLEHTMSFTNKDNFDGYEASKKFVKNDVYYFTNLYFQFYLKGRKYRSDEKRNPVNDNTTTTNTTTTPPCISPTVRIINPSQQGETVESEFYEFFATVSNVTDKNDISVNVNGRQIYDFKFNAQNGRISTYEVLVNGQNSFSVSARNACGSNQQTSTVIYQQRMPEPPVVYFTNPATSPITTTANNFNIVAKVLNVSGKSSITFKQNGTVNNNFSYNNNTKELTSYVVLQNGSNVFEVTGTNQDGTAVATTVIIYGRTPACQNPIISMKQPSNNPEHTNSPAYTLIGNVMNVDTRNQISVTLNNQATTTFTFNTNEKSLNARMQLKQGANTVTITAKNNCGTTTETYTIIYTPTQVNPPTVSFVTPYQSNTSVANSNYTFVATTTNISNASQIKVSFNGVNLTNFSFASDNRQILFNTPLIEGNNVATIVVTNNDGTATATTTVLYRKVVNAPTVQFTDPSISPKSVFKNTYNLVAQTTNVTAQSQISFYVNGSKTTAFNFNPATNTVTYSAMLNEGANVFKITVQTNGGSAQDETTIIYMKRQLAKIPTVQFTSPSSSIEVKTNAYNLIAQTENVENNSQISITKNGNALTNFTFNANTQTVNFSSALDEGNNKFVIKVTTNGGSAQDDVNIKYNREVIIPMPTVKWTNPASSGMAYMFEAYDFKAVAKNVYAKNKIAITFNNNPVTDFNYSATSGEITFSGKLAKGNNTLKVQVSNDAGNATDETSIVYRVPVVICDKPVVTINKPTTQNVSAAYKLTGKITNITNEQGATVILNGTSIGNLSAYNANDKTFIANLNLTEGTNVVEVRATNKCGISSAFINLNVATCYAPEIGFITPQTASASTENTTYSVSFGVTHIANQNQLSMTVNGTAQTLTFDKVNNRVNATVNLVVGTNTIVLNATNECGKANKTLTITRTVCNKPTISVTNVSANNNGTTMNKFFSLTANVKEIDNNSQISVTQNGTAVNFVFNANTKVLTLDLNNKLGKNTIVIKLTNKCGVETYTHVYTQQEDPNAKPPIVKFTKPTSVVTVEESAYSFSATTSYVTEKGQLAVKLNGQTVSFNFNQGTITFNGTLKEGNNTAVIYAVTPYGSAEATATVNYVKKPTVVPPVITITSHSCPIQLSAGLNTISGNVTNVQNVNDVKFYIDNAEINNVTKNFANGKVTFTYSITARSSNTTQTLKITATNSAQTVTKTCVIKYPSTNNSGTGNSGGSNAPTIPTKTRQTPAGQNVKIENIESTPIETPIKSGNIKSGNIRTTKP